MAQQMDATLTKGVVFKRAMIPMYVRIIRTRDYENGIFLQKSHSPNRRNGKISGICWLFFGCGFFLWTEITPQNQNDLDGNADHENVPNNLRFVVIELELDTERKQ